MLKSFRFPLVIVGYRRSIEHAWLDALLGSVWRKEIGRA